LAGQWISPGTPVFSTNKTDCQDITDILLKKALSTMPPIPLSKTIQDNNCHINYLILITIKWCFNATFNNIQLCRLVASHWQILSHNIVPNAHRLSGIQIHNVGNNLGKNKFTKIETD
jgi:hypothetical protein